MYVYAFPIRIIDFRFDQSTWLQLVAKNMVIQPSSTEISGKKYKR